MHHCGQYISDVCHYTTTFHTVQHVRLQQVLQRTIVFLTRFATTGKLHKPARFLLQYPPAYLPACAERALEMRHIRLLSVQKVAQLHTGRPYD